MDNVEFSRIRKYLNKTQVELARLLSVSPKAIQSFEQGWRNISPSIERMLLFLLINKTAPQYNMPCWESTNCDKKKKENCPAWEFKAGNLCWFINGTICHGEIQKNWQDKMTICRECDVFKNLLPVKTE